MFAAPTQSAPQAPLFLNIINAVFGPADSAPVDAAEKSAASGDVAAQLGLRPLALGVGADRPAHSVDPCLTSLCENSAQNRSLWSRLNVEVCEIKEISEPRPKQAVQRCLFTQTLTARAVVSEIATAQISVEENYGVAAQSIDPGLTTVFENSARNRSLWSRLEVGEPRPEEAVQPFVFAQTLTAKAVISEIDSALVSVAGNTGVSTQTDPGLTARAVGSANRVGVRVAAPNVIARSLIESMVGQNRKTISKTAPPAAPCGRGSIRAREMNGSVPPPTTAAVLDPAMPVLRVEPQPEEVVPAAQNNVQDNAARAPVENVAQPVVIGEVAFKATLTPIENPEPEQTEKISAKKDDKPVFALPEKFTSREEPVKVAAVATIAETMNNVPRSCESPASQDRPVAVKETKSETPFREVAQALRTADVDVPGVPIPKAGAVHSIALKIAQPDAPSVELHVTERAGEIHVAVKTQDAGLQTSLRQDLGTLSNSLERAGYRTQTYVPCEAQIQTARTPSSEFRRDSESQQFSGRNGENPQQRDQRRQRQPKKWIEALENLQ